MNSLVLSAILLSFSASFAQTQESHELKMNTTCEACVKKIDANVCQKFKGQLSECKPVVGGLSLKGTKIDMAAIKKAIKDTGYTIQSESAKPASTHAH